MGFVYQLAIVEVFHAKMATYKFITNINCIGHCQCFREFHVENIDKLIDLVAKMPTVRDILSDHLAANPGHRESMPI